MKINLQFNKMMIKMNKQRYFDVSFRYSRASWGVLGCPGVIRPTQIQVNKLIDFDRQISDGYLCSKRHNFLICERILIIQVA